MCGRTLWSRMVRCATCMRYVGAKGDCDSRGEVCGCKTWVRLEEASAECRMHSVDAIHGTHVILVIVE